VSRPFVPLGMRFWDKVSPEPNTGCWLWAGSVDAAGYGQLGAGGKRGRPLKAHRVAWELTFGPLPAGMFACHRCDNPGCVNPAHLFVGAPAENTADMIRKGRQKKPNAKLTTADVLAIRRSYAGGGVTHADLSGRFGVSRAAISMLLKRHTWREVQ
jgi:hypothetical protein